MRENERARERGTDREEENEREKGRMQKRRTVNANASILVKIANSGSELIMEQPMGLALRELRYQK